MDRRLVPFFVVTACCIQWYSLHWLIYGSCCRCRVHLRAICLQPFRGNVISWMQSLQPTLQIGLWAAVDNMWHYLAFATRAHVGCWVAARPHFFWLDAQWLWLVQKRFRSAQWHLGRWDPGCWLVGLSTRQKLTTGADVIHLATGRWCLLDSVYPERPVWWQAISQRENT